MFAPDGTHHECYGRMFPNLTNGSPETRGKAFVIGPRTQTELEQPRAKVSVNLAEWDRCRECPEFDHCLSLSTATLSIQAAAWQL
jgi:hypothetical protein